MKTVITYGTYDLLHYGHIRLLERAKALGDYLIVGVTSDDFDKRRGKVNNKQPLEKRIESVMETGLADKIIVEEYEGQKIDDIKKYGADIFTVGSDWEGHFDYLKEYCEVIYLPRTLGVSSSEKRDELQHINVGIIGSMPTLIEKFIEECKFVNGIKIVGIYNSSNTAFDISPNVPNIETLEDLYEASDAVYVVSDPKEHYEHIRDALIKNKSVLCESPITLDDKKTKELFDLANEKSCILQEGIKTAFSTAYWRMLLLLKSNAIGDIISIDATCTSLSTKLSGGWSGITYWLPTALLPGFQIFGTDYVKCDKVVKNASSTDNFTSVNMIYPNGIVSVKAGSDVKSEGELIISGSRGYIYVPSPWWKTDYFEIRYENPANNKKYFYQLDGEGIRYEIVEFLHSVNDGKSNHTIDKKISIAISKILNEIKNSKEIFEIKN